MHSVAAGAHWMLTPVMGLFEGSGQRVAAPVNSANRGPSAVVVPHPDNTSSDGGSGGRGNIGGGGYMGSGGVDMDEELGDGGSVGSAATADGRAGGGISARGMTWAASLGRRKTTAMNGGASAGTGGVGNGPWNGYGNGGHGGPRGHGRAGGGWGKRTGPRTVPAGCRAVFKTQPGECYFRVGGGGGGGASREEAPVGAGGVGSREGERRAVGSGRSYPSIGDSVSAGRCSLAVLIRGGEGAAGEMGRAATGWRHRPTHRVTWQVSTDISYSSCRQISAENGRNK